MARKRIGGRNDKMNRHIEQIMDYAHKGLFGTPEHQNKTGTNREVFWACFNGSKMAEDFKGSVNYPSARAGEMFKEEYTNKENEMKETPT